MASPSSDRTYLVQNEFEVKRLIIEVYLTIMKRNQLNSTQLNEIWSKINILEQTHETIDSLRSEFCILLSSILEDLRCRSSITEGSRKGDGDLKRFSTPPSNKIESLESQNLLMGFYHHMELDEFVDMWCRVQRLRGEEPCCCPEQLDVVMSQFMSLLSFWTRKGSHPIPDADHTLRDHCLRLTLLTQLNTCTSSVSVGRASSKVFDIENPPHESLVYYAAAHPFPDVSHVDERFDRAGASSFLKKNSSPWCTPIGKTSQKMDARANKSPSLDQEEDLEGKLEDMSNFALFLSALSYGVIYLFGSAKIGRNGDDATVICLHAWTSVMMVLLFVGSYIRWPASPKDYACCYVWSNLCVRTRRFHFGLL